MKIFIIILAVGSVLIAIRALIISYKRMPVGGNLITMLTYLPLINYIPIINFVLYVVVIIYKLLHARIK